MTPVSQTDLRAKVGEEAVEVCSVRVGETLFCVPITRTLEILGAPAIHPVPLAPGYIGGLVHYRGEVLTVISLRALLEMMPFDGACDVVVFEGMDGYFGVLVDAVGGVLQVPLDAIEPNPTTLDDRRKALFAGTCRLQDRLLVMLDADRLDPTRLSN